MPDFNKEKEQPEISIRNEVMNAVLGKTVVANSSKYPYNGISYRCGTTKNDYIQTINMYEFLHECKQFILSYDCKLEIKMTKGFYDATVRRERGDIMYRGNRSTELGVVILICEWLINYKVLAKKELLQHIIENEKSF